LPPTLCLFCIPSLGFCMRLFFLMHSSPRARPQPRLFFLGPWLLGRLREGTCSHHFPGSSLWGSRGETSTRFVLVRQGTLSHIFPPIRISIGPAQVSSLRFFPSPFFVFLRFFVLVPFFRHLFRIPDPSICCRNTLLAGKVWFGPKAARSFFFLFTSFFLGFRARIPRTMCHVRARFLPSALFIVTIRALV